MTRNQQIHADFLLAKLVGNPRRHLTKKHGLGHVQLYSIYRDMENLLREQYMHSDISVADWRWATYYQPMWTRACELDKSKKGLCAAVVKDMYEVRYTPKEIKRYTKLSQGVLDTMLGV